MTTDVGNFLVSLANAIAGLTGLEMAAVPRSIWAGEAVEAVSTPVYTVLRIYDATEPGAFAGMRVPRVSVQADTRGNPRPATPEPTDSMAVLARAWQVHEQFLDDERRPRMHWIIPGRMLTESGEGGTLSEDPGGGWEIRLVRFISGPAVVGRDEDGRWAAASNYDIEFERIAP